MNVFAIKGRPAVFGDKEQIEWIKQLEQFSECRKITFKKVAYNRTVKFNCTCGEENWSDIPVPYTVKYFDCSGAHCFNEYAIINTRFEIQLFCTLDENEE